MHYCLNKQQERTFPRKTQYAACGYAARCVGCRSAVRAVGYSRRGNRGAIRSIPASSMHRGALHLRTEKQEGREEGYSLAGSESCAVGELSAHDELVAIGLRSHAGKLAELLVEIASVIEAGTLIHLRELHVGVLGYQFLGILQAQTHAPGAESGAVLGAYRRRAAGA